MHRFGTFEAKNRFSALLDLVEGGEEVTITRNGKPVARLVSVETRETRDVDKARKAVQGFRDLRKRVKPDPDGLTARDYVQMGRRY